MIGWIVLGVLALFVGTLVVRAALFRAPEETAATPADVQVDAAKAAEALAALVRCKTVSHADPALDDAAEFTRLEALLPSLYPLVHRTLTREKIPPRGLLYRWKGGNADAPLVLTAHYDVVPADGDGWDGDPFSGEIAEGLIHGRGTLDTKCTLAAILTAAETLIAQGFVPARDIYFCFGGDEEVMGGGAKAIAATLEARGVKPLMVVDEGGAIVENVFPGVAQPCALIGIAEKGSVNYTATALSAGGHSSAPPVNSPLTLLSDAVRCIRQKPFRFRITEPARALVRHLAPHSTFVYRLIFANLWAFAPVLDMITRKSGGELNALFRTTVAFTVMRGGDAANVLPQSAELTMNVRVLPGESIQSTLQGLRARVTDKRVAIALLRGLAPSQVSSTAGEGYAALTQSIREVYAGVLTSPYLMIAASDARHYERICGHVFRFSGMPLSSAERKMIHGVNERIPVAKQADAARFFMRLMDNAAGCA